MWVTGGLPPVPVTVNVYVPLLALEGTCTLNDDEVVAGLGVKVPVAPGGRPVTERFTGELNPLDAVIVTV